MEQILLEPPAWGLDGFTHSQLSDILLKPDNIGLSGQPRTAASIFVKRL